MAALTQDRNTPVKYVERTVRVPVATNVKIFVGALVSRNATGFLIPAADTAGTKVIGVSSENVDNTGGADGAKSALVMKGVFRLGTTGANAVTQADMGNDVYVSDDQTVLKAAGPTNDIPAGTLEAMDGAADVWIAVGL